MGRQTFPKGPDSKCLGLNEQLKLFMSAGSAYKYLQAVSKREGVAVFLEHKNSARELGLLSTVCQLLL